jgi:hypothetical protein
MSKRNVLLLRNAGRHYSASDLHKPGQNGPRFTAAELISMVRKFPDALENLSASGHRVTWY